MKGILADNDVIGQVNILIRILKGAYWSELWESLGLVRLEFGDLDLKPDDPDEIVWEKCQQHEVALITGNRNADDPKSLEVTIRQRNTIDSYPVFTLADSARVLDDANYAESVAVSLLDYLLEIDDFRGSGRLWLP